MFDLDPNSDLVQTFVGSQSAGGAISTSQSWSKPSGASWIYMMLVSGGASGGAGRSDVSGSLRSGGGGGGSGSVVKLLLPASVCPDQLWVRPAGATQRATGVGLGGSSSIVAIEPIEYNQAKQFAIALPPAGGAVGTGAAVAGGAAAAAAQSVHMGMGYTLGLVLALPGLTGGGSAVNNHGASIVSHSGSLFLPGCGGAGIAAVDSGFNSGQVDPSAYQFPYVRSAVPATSSGEPGPDGYTAWTPFLHGRCGYGGACFPLGTGGRGGDGGIGSGGGGGGAGITGGQGGAGGPGLILIGAW